MAAAYSTLSAHKEDLPYVLCPNLDDLNVNVIPLWFRPKGGARECPVIVLENAPASYDSVLTACHFIKRTDGWLIDVTEKDESFWKRIFGNIEFVKRQPVKIFEPNKLIYAPLPPSVHTVVKGFTDEHITFITKADSIIGIEAIRLCHKNALEGAINSRGAWSVIKAAALDRLTKNPEDVATFEYIWSTAKAYSLDASGLPASITHESLLRKVIERQRLTAQMEKVLPVWYRRPGPTNFIVKADWLKRTAILASEFGGPIETKSFYEVEGLAQFLIDVQSEPLSDTDISRHRDRFQIPVEDDHDWADDLDLPTVESITHPQPVVELTPPANWCFKDTFKKLNELHSTAIRRVDYSKTISQLLFKVITDQRNLDITNVAFLTNFKELLDSFASVTSDDTLFKVWSRDEQNIRELIASLVTDTRAKMQLMPVFASFDSLKKYIAANTAMYFDDQERWWCQGFSFSRTPSIPDWQIFKNVSGTTQPVGTAMYKTVAQASDALHQMVLRSRFQRLKTSIRSNQYFVAYKTRSGAILQLSDYVEGPIPEETFDQTIERRGSYTYPILWTAKSNVWALEDVKQRFAQLETALGISGPNSFLNGRLTLCKQGNEVAAYFDQRHVSTVQPGAVSIVWAEAFLSLLDIIGANTTYLPLLKILSGNEQRSDLDIGTEEDLLDMLSELTGELSARIDRSIENDLRKAILSPSPESESLCTNLWYSLRETQCSDELRELIRGITLFAAQHRPHLKMSLAYQEAMRIGVGRRELIKYALVRFLWYRLKWSGLHTDEIQAVGLPGDLPQGELFPEESTQWMVFMELELLLESALSSDSTTSREVPDQQDQYRAPSLLR